MIVAFYLNSRLSASLVLLLTTLYDTSLKRKRRNGKTGRITIWPVLDLLEMPTALANETALMPPHCHDDQESWNSQAQLRLFGTHNNVLTSKIIGQVHLDQGSL